MKFNVTGADRETGEDIEMTLDAADVAAAQEAANRRGIVVARVVPVSTRPTVQSAVHRVAPIQAPLEQGHAYGAPVINVALPRRSNSLGVASIVLGLIAFLICWIPLVNLLGSVLAAVGLVLGLVGLIVALSRKGASIGYPIAGSLLNGLALIVVIGMASIFVGTVQQVGKAVQEQSDRASATNQVGTASGHSDDQPGTAGADPSVAPAATPVATATAPPPRRPEAEWASAEAPVRQGDVQLRVKSARVGQVRLTETIGGGTSRSKDALLMISLEISNLSETKKVNYRSWGADATSFGTRAALVDNFGNQYRLTHFRFGTNVEGSVRAESIYPGKSVDDVIVFEQPIQRAEYLNLELPAAQFGGEGMLRVRIPASMIEWP